MEPIQLDLTGFHRQIVAGFNRTVAGRIRAARLRAGQTPVEIGGSREEGAKLGYFQTALTDGTTGFYQRRADDCVQAALASCVQIPPHQVPDLRLDDRLAAGTDPEEIARSSWAKLERWADSNGLTVTVHPTPPTSARRWIGVIERSSGGDPFNDHCLVMEHSVCRFDPAACPGAGGERTIGQRVHVDWGLTIE